MLLAAAIFTCTPIAVWDGDGAIWCAEGQKIRLHNVWARELDGSCLPNHPCPKASGIAARDALVNLLGGAKGRLSTGHIKVKSPPLTCTQHGTSYGRIVASCTLPDGRDLGQSLIRLGVAL